MDADGVLASRLARQRLTGLPAATALQVVSELLCVQSQDAPLARAMIALRCAGAEDATVRAAVAAGEVVRTHILRPTWHYVAAKDLRWLLRLTSPKVESGMAARHRVLELAPRRIDVGLGLIAERLARRAFASRTELGVAFAEAGLLDRDDPQFGQQVGHLLLVAELRGLICSAPLDLLDHRYALVDDVVPAAQEFNRASALDVLVERFIAGHGPVALTDLTRWARITLTEARAAASRLGEAITATRVDGVELWSPSAAAPVASDPARAWLLSTFDEAFLSYRAVPWPRSPHHPDSDEPYRFAEAGGGVVILDRRDVGSWKRTRPGGRTQITLRLDPTLSGVEREAVDAAVHSLVRILG